MAWTKLDDQYFTREGEGGDVTRFRHFNPAEPGDGKALTFQRWKHTDGRYAAHVSDADPELLVLDAAGPDDDGTVLREYDLQGKGVDPDGVDPLKGAREVRAVVAPRPEDDDDAWGILRGWS